MTDELSSAYDPKSVEKDIYAKWQKAEAFNADPVSSGESNTFAMVIPPPNVTAALHLGHALNNTLQDVLIRYKRMNQFATLWMPGTDHAGIATQTVVEKRILSEEGKKRTDFEREDFVARIRQWKDQFEATIINQLKMMGCSCDWRRTRFTMDETCASAVRETFHRLFTDDVIYRGKRLVNWDPATQTVLADDEVEHEDVNGYFWYLQYPLDDAVEIAGERITHITVATTRPETMLGDTAIAMNPKDPRAGALAGKMVRLPLVGRKIPIIIDDHVVLPDSESDDEKARFSTGFLKVTPAHDLDDWAIGLRHDLPVINVLGPDGSISDRHGWDDAAGTDAQFLIGLDRFEARKAIVEWFKKENLLADVRDYLHSVGYSYRSHVPIEPYLSDQWYIAVKKPIERLAEKFGDGMIADTDVPANSLAGLALAPLLDGQLKFTPERYARTYQNWLENLRDWPISRQLWWGHQIPIWTKDVSSNVSGDDAVENKLQEIDANFAIQRCEHPEDASLTRVFIELNDDNSASAELIESLGYVRDSDVLDTWFSSALWPFSTLGWPEKSPSLDSFYPGDVLCTAREIITLWVSRMVMMGQYCIGDIPFSDVFIHAMIQDGDGRKMSKSLGNGIDPLVVIDSHGADAMRFTLCSMTTQTQDVRMPVNKVTLPDGRVVNSSDKFDIGRNFCNKLWNAARFALSNISPAPLWSDISPTASLSDAWILSRLGAAVREASTAIDSYKFSELSDKLYHFVWDEFCDWYLEAAKARINAGDNTPRAILAHCLDIICRLLHPVMPYITETIWEKLNAIAPNRSPGDMPAEQLLITANWPRCDSSTHNEKAEGQFCLLIELIRQIRTVRTAHNVVPKRQVDLIIKSSTSLAQIAQDNILLVKTMARVGELTFESGDMTIPKASASITVAGDQAYVLDIIDPVAELARLNKQAQILSKGIASTAGKLNNEKFTANAPEKVIQQQRDRLTEMTTQLDAIEKSIAMINKQ